MKGTVIKMVYIYLAEGFEETEALVPLDLLRRAGISVSTVSVTEDAFVTGAHKITVRADITVKDAAYAPERAELIMLPGGMPGTKNLDASAAVHSALDSAYADGRFIAAICAAPSVIGKKGFLKGKKAVSYPGFEQYLYGRIETDEKCVRDGRVITAVSAGAAIDFGLKMVAALCGEEKAKEIKNAILA